MNTIRILFEGKYISLNIPEGWRVIGKLEPRTMPKLNNLQQSLRESLMNPIGCPSLNSNNLTDKKIVIAVDDISRPTPTHLYFGEILEFLFKLGAKRENILVMMATGTHRDMTEDEVYNKVGKENLKNIRWQNNNCKDISKHIELGITKRGTKVFLNRHLKDADLILCIGAIEPHPLLGFGGGLKMILPGLAYKDTVACNHMQGVSPNKFNYLGYHQSPMRFDLEEAALMLKKDIFIIDALLNEDLQICKFICGDPIKAHREGIKIVESLKSVKIKELADVVITSSSPMNADMRQGLKCIANASRSIIKNGVILALMECKYGVGDIKIPPKEIPFGHKLFRLVIKFLGKNRILWFIDKVKKDVSTEERFLSHFAMQIAINCEMFIFSNNLPPNIDKKFGLFKQFDDLDNMIQETSKLVPKDAKVYILPHGGATYIVC